MVLIIGGTGTVGSAAVRAVLAAGGEVRALVRSDAAAARLPQGAVAVRGDARDEASLERAVRGVSAVLFVAPHVSDEEELADRVVRVCERAGTRLVFVGVHANGGSRPARAVQRFIFGRLAPHYLPKLRLSERVRRSATRPVILAPANFFQNDELFLPELLEGHFVQCFEKPVNRVDVRDIGLAAARALLDDGFPSGAYPLVGPESLTGEACARLWSEALGRGVRCDGSQQRLDAAMARALEGTKREDFMNSYRVLRKFAVPTRPAEVARTTELLGRPPTPYAAYVAERAQALLAREHRLAG